MKSNPFVIWGLKLALSVAFISAVADRFGVWGKSGKGGVVWGDFAHFVAYTKSLNPWFPAAWIGPLAYFVTALELALGVLLLTTWKSREVALLSGLLLLSFGAAMAFSVGLKPALDYSVFSAAFAAFALSCLSKG
ncbi:hypothetical protein AXK11_00255 [Cephaloticoccus primus]|uniref:DoxX family protein n=1 Tax=Cephaloticoccus primus TaxID=1548207 RepID=A0A139ST94_9BACT|nr:MauE/DoxX family redox-associated membrane protein [Cephaloticoccus primus]KXU37701.1 hypothetical protein AXK11_00255 [Cephaloticoccus primus]